MKLTSFTDYAMRILLMLTHDRTKLLTIAEVASYYDISESHLTKVVHTLGRSGWVETVRGRHGGMRLSADPNALRLDQIVTYLEESFDLVECFSADNTCRLSGVCGIQTALGEARRSFEATLSQHTLASVAAHTAFAPDRDIPARPQSVKVPLAKLIKRSEAG